MHKCSQCGRSDVPFYRRKSGGPQSMCIECHKDYVRTHTDKSQKRTKAREAAQRLRAKLDDLKRAPCADCGREDLPFLMDFDHRPGTEKLFNIGCSLNLGEKRVMAEVEKCDVVCCRCHRIRTHARRARR